MNTADSAQGTSVSPNARSIWRAARMPVIIGLVIVAVSIVTVLVAPGERQLDSLDPGSFDRSGSHALSRVLEAQGVHVELVHTFSEATRTVQADRDTTLLITVADPLAPNQLDALRRGTADLVLVAPDRPATEALSTSVQTVGSAAVANRPPNCSLADAKAAGTATMGGLLYRVTGGADFQRCYPHADAASLVQWSAGGTTVTLLGTGAPLTNRKLAEVGNAALAMRLLGKHHRLVWYMPSLGDPSLRANARSFYDLLPAGARFGAAQVAVGVLLLALWRARRLGPVVAEPLPVVVRAAETVEGRARLYRKARAVDHAAATLRQAAHARLVRRVGLTSGADPASAVSAVARHAGRPDAEVFALLYGPPPRDAAALVELADALDALEKEVSRR